MRSNTLFWLINTAGWFTYLLCAGLFLSYLSGNVTTDSLLIQLFAFCYYLPTSGLLRLVVNRSGWFSGNKHLILAPALLLFTFLLALFGQFLVSLFMMHALHIMTWETYSFSILVFTALQNWIILCLWLALYLMLKQVRNNRQQQLKQIQLESSLQATELMALKAQLNPHFIFNCLNNMRAMAIDDSEKTREMITNLSEILKYSFQFGEQTQVTVEKELQHVKNYLALEDIQFEQRLSYEFDVTPETRQQLIPTLSIQLLVENGIKHGIMGSPEGGHIIIKVAHTNDKLVIDVTNTGELKFDDNDSKSSGVGLKNLRKRLQLVYPGEASLQLKVIDSNHVSAEIKIPWQQK